MVDKYNCGKIIFNLYINIEINGHTIYCIEKIEKHWC